MQESSSSAEALAATSTLVDVRSATASLAVTGPKSLRRGRTARFTFSGTTELSRYVRATVKRAGGRGCGTSSETDSGDSLPSMDRVQGAFAVRSVPWRLDIDEPGRYLICAWVQESHGDLAPEAFATFRFRVRRRG